MSKSVSIEWLQDRLVNMSVQANLIYRQLDNYFVNPIVEAKFLFELQDITMPPYNIEFPMLDCWEDPIYLKRLRDQPDLPLSPDQVTDAVKRYISSAQELVTLLSDNSVEWTDLDISRFKEGEFSEWRDAANKNIQLNLLQLQKCNYDSPSIFDIGWIVREFLALKKFVKLVLHKTSEFLESHPFDPDSKSLESVCKILQTLLALSVPAYHIERVETGDNSNDGIKFRQDEELILELEYLFLKLDIDAGLMIDAIGRMEASLKGNMSKPEIWVSREWGQEAIGVLLELRSGTQKFLYD